MAIKIGGTTVIDDSRSLTNIVSIDATTATTLTNAGIGGGAGSVTVIASGTIPTGVPVILNSDGTASVATSVLTSSNFIGFSDGSYTNGQTATVKVVGAIANTAETLTAGTQYYVSSTSGGLSTSPDSPSVLAGTAVNTNQIIVKR